MSGRPRLPVIEPPTFDQMAGVEGVYLIHLQTPIRHAFHYIGWAQDIAARLQQHLDGNGAALLAHANRLQIPWRVVRVWPGADRLFERQLKTVTKQPRLLCPVCLERYRQERRDYMRARRARPSSSSHALDGTGQGPPAGVLPPTAAGGAPPGTQASEVS